MKVFHAGHILQLNHVQLTNRHTMECKIAVYKLNDYQGTEVEVMSTDGLGI